MRFAVCLAFLSLALLPPAQVQAQPPLKGVISDLSKDETKPTGTISVTVNGKTTTYVVDDSTVFQVLKGTVSSPSSFLNEHKGENVAVFGVAGSNPLKAARVQILLPADVFHFHLPSMPGFVHGTVVHRGPHRVTIRVPDRKPIVPVIGTVVDVSKNKDTDGGSLIVSINGKNRMFAMDGATWFDKVQGPKKLYASFLSLDKGEQVRVYPRPGNELAAGRVDIMLPGTPAVPPLQKAHHHHHHLITYLVDGATKYVAVKGTQYLPSNLANVLVGEHVAVQHRVRHKHWAHVVRIIFPHPIRGVVQSVGTNVVNVKVTHHHGQGKPASEKIVPVGVLPGTLFFVFNGTTSKPGGLGDIKVGSHVVLRRTAVPPHVAEVAEIHHSLKQHSYRGVVTGLAGNQLTIAQEHRDKTRPPNPVNFTLTQGTQLELPKSRGRVIPGVGLRVGSHVSVLAQGYANELVGEKVTLHHGNDPAHVTGKQTGKQTTARKGNTTPPKKTPPPPPRRQPPKKGK